MIPLLLTLVATGLSLSFYVQLKRKEGEAAQHHHEKMLLVRILLTERAIANCVQAGRAEEAPRAVKAALDFVRYTPPDVVIGCIIAELDERADERAAARELQ